MIATITVFLSGLIFGLGLILGGMANPQKVLAFLDIAGPWDPSLAFVMIGAIAIASLAFALARRRNRSYLGFPISLPTSRIIDKRLVLGSIAFGVGWGMAGICPGPALVLLGSGYTESVVFVGSMLLGMGIFEVLQKNIAGRYPAGRKDGNSDCAINTAPGLK